VVMKFVVFWEVTLWLLERHSTFQRNKSTPPSGSNNATCFRIIVLLNLFDIEYGGDMLLRNVGRISNDYTALYRNSNLS
jgi:hypothetical protein